MKVGDTIRIVLLVVYIEIKACHGSSRARGFYKRLHNAKESLMSQSSEADNNDDDDSISLLQTQRHARSKFWPPWPFTMIRSKEEEAIQAAATREDDTPVSALGKAWSVSKRSARVAARNFQLVGSQLWFHLPPAAPPLLILACMPRTEQGVEEMTKRTIIPLLSNPFVRSMALSGATLAFLSWAHSELWRKRCLTPLPLAEPYRDINRAILPPFLPEAVNVCLLSNSATNHDSQPDEQEEVDTETRLPPQLQRHWKQFRDSAPKARTLKVSVQDWWAMRKVRQCERRNAARLAIYDELVALQKLKQTARRRKQLKHTKPDNDLGYALVTGASKGIGRALAVELARWEIPLILVARDADALVALAYDLETCYGIDCFVLPADLAQDSTAKRVYQSVRKAGLKVDVSIARLS